VNRPLLESIELAARGNHIASPLQDGQAADHSSAFRRQSNIHRRLVTPPNANGCRYFNNSGRANLLP